MKEGDRVVALATIEPGTAVIYGRGTYLGMRVPNFGELALRKIRIPYCIMDAVGDVTEFSLWGNQTNLILEADFDEEFKSFMKEVREFPENFKIQPLEEEVVV